MVEESVADDDMVMIRGSSGTAAVSVLLRGANDYMLDEMDRSLHDAFCVVKRVLESGKVVAGARALRISALQLVPLQRKSFLQVSSTGAQCGVVYLKQLFDRSLIATASQAL